MQVCDTTAELAAGMVDSSGWPELLPFIFQLVQAQNPNEVESALLIFAQLAHYIMPTLTQYMGTLNGILQQCLQSNRVDVAIAAMRATTAFIQELDDGADRDKFQVPLAAAQPASLTLTSCLAAQLRASATSHAAQREIAQFQAVRQGPARRP